jgi:hypothetical protein
MLIEQIPQIVHVVPHFMTLIALVKPVIINVLLVMYPNLIAKFVLILLIEAKIIPLYVPVIKDILIKEVKLQLVDNASIYVLAVKYQMLIAQNVKELIEVVLSLLVCVWMDIMTMVQMQIVYNVIINVKHVQDLPIIV